MIDYILHLNNKITLMKFLHIATSSDISLSSSLIGSMLARTNI